ncbi:MAG: ankyrin repeat domain-containing protein, partial [Nitrospinota bacterium]
MSIAKGPWILWLLFLSALLVLASEVSAIPSPISSSERTGRNSNSPTFLAQSAPDPDELAAYQGLHAAVAKGDISAVRGLITGGSGLNKRDPHGRTPLMVAAYRRDKKVVRILIDAGAKVNALDSEQYDLLTIAAVLNDVEMVKLAIESGADTGLITSPYQGTALIAAA